MTNEEFQKLVLEKLVSIESTMATKNELSTVKAELKNDIGALAIKIESGFADVIKMSDVTQKEVQSIRRDLRAIEAVTAKN